MKSHQPPFFRFAGLLLRLCLVNMVATPAIAQRNFSGRYDRRGFEENSPQFVIRGLSISRSRAPQEKLTDPE